MHRNYKSKSNKKLDTFYKDTLHLTTQKQRYLYGASIVAL